MHIVITGGSGFLGLRLAKALLRDGVNGEPVTTLALVDRAHRADLADPRLRLLAGDIADPGFVSEFLSNPVDILYHLAAVVSSEAESDFDLGMKVNIDASRQLLDACRKLAKVPRVIFTSSVAVFGPLADGESLTDASSVDPRSSYGMEKAVGELLIKDYSRRGFVDGVVLRLPTISVRPGVPNRAASSFASSIIREPLSGQSAICPVDPGTLLWLMSPRAAIRALQKAGALPSSAFTKSRVINLPGITVSVGDMLEALTAIGGPASRALVKIEIDAGVEAIISSWPRGWEDQVARSIGFEADANFGEIVQAFIDDDLDEQRARLALST